MPHSVLIITGDPLGERMAGPAIRAWHIASALADRGHDVRLVSLTAADRHDPRFEITVVRPGDDAAMSPLERWAELIVFQGHALHVFDSLRRSSKPMLIDIYDPMHLEQLEQARSFGEEVWTRAVEEATTLLNDQLRRGDFFICASERQRRFYLGQLAGVGRLNPATYRDDPDFRHLIDVVPFGLSAIPPVHTRAVLRGARPGFGDDDRILVWAGGLYDWFDPETLIRAVALLSERRPEIRLFFLGTRHPNPAVPEMPIVATSRELASELGVLDEVVFFNDEWVEYDDRQNYLLEADLGVSTHYEHIETEFSFRTRILDYLWAGLPIVSTRGDGFAEAIEEAGMGATVPARDPVALASAIETVLYDGAARESARQSVSRTRSDYFWDRVLAPVLRFADDPRRARDLPSTSGADPATAARPTGLRHDVRRAASLLRSAGPRVVAGRVLRRLGGRGA